MSDYAKKKKREKTAHRARSGRNARSRSKSGRKVKKERSPKARAILKDLDTERPVRRPAIWHESKGANMAYLRSQRQRRTAVRMLRQHRANVQLMLRQRTPRRGYPDARTAQRRQREGAAQERPNKRRRIEGG